MKEKLRELLKTIPEVKENMEKLEFGCDIEVDGGIRNTYDRTFEGYSIEIIIGTLKERHLRMYCKSIKISCEFSNDKIVLFNKKGQGNFTQKIIENNKTKDFDQQSDEVYEKIYNFLKNL